MLKSWKSFKIIYIIKVVKFADIWSKYNFDSPYQIVINISKLYIHRTMYWEEMMYFQSGEASTITGFRVDEICRYKLPPLNLNIVFWIFKDGVFTQNLHHNCVNYQVFLFTGRNLLDPTNWSRFVTVEMMWLLTFELGIIMM